jgi:hypothetical protein
MNPLNLVIPPWITALWGMLKAIPWWVYVGVAAITFAALKVEQYGEGRYAAGQADEAKRAIAAQAAADAAASSHILEAQLEAQRAKAEAEAAAEKKQKINAGKIAVLKGQINAYLSAERLASYPNIPNGIVRYATDAATFANGGNAPIGGARTIFDDQPSNISLTRWKDYIVEQAGAFRACREWGIGWRDYAGRLRGQCEAVISTLKGEKK